LHSYPVRDRGVVGVSIHNSKIYCIHCESQWIKVYGASKPYNFFYKIDVSGMKNPSDLLLFDDCLYVPDNRTPKRDWFIRNPDSDHQDIDHCIWKISLKYSASREKLLTSLGKWWPWSLSRTLDGRQIIITTKAQVAYFWSPTTNEPVMVTLPADVRSPEHIIELSVGLYLICSDPRYHSSHRKVCKLACYGKEMNFTESPSDMKYLDNPRHLAKLPDGRILVIDHFNHRILIMGKDLRSHKVLLCPENGGESRPCRIAYDSGSNLLLVGFHLSVGLYSLNFDVIGPQWANFV